MKQYDLYIFDFDMTLFDSFAGVRDAYRKAFSAVGIPLDESMCSQYIRESIDQTFARYSDSPCRFREFVSAFINESQRSMTRNTTIFPESSEVIKTLFRKEKHLCIASSKTEDRIVAILEKHQLLKYFEHIIGYERTLSPKPSPYCLEWCISQYDIPLERICYVGDGAKDMLAAKAAGIDGIQICREDTEDVSSTISIRDLRELLQCYRREDWKIEKGK